MYRNVIKNTITWANSNGFSKNIFSTRHQYLQGVILRRKFFCYLPEPEHWITENFFLCDNKFCCWGLWLPLKIGCLFKTIFKKKSSVCSKMTANLKYLDLKYFVINTWEFPFVLLGSPYFQSSWSKSFRNALTFRFCSFVPCGLFSLHSSRRHVVYWSNDHIRDIGGQINIFLDTLTFLTHIWLVFVFWYFSLI